MRGPDVFVYPQEGAFPALVTVGEEGIGGEGNNNNVVDLVPTELPPAYQSTTSHQIGSDVMILHPVTSLPLSTPPSYRTINSNNNARATSNNNTVGRIHNHEDGTRNSNDSSVNNSNGN